LPSSEFFLVSNGNSCRPFRSTVGSSFVQTAGGGGPQEAGKSELSLSVARMFFGKKTDKIKKNGQNKKKTQY
jgi:hypothetical protein